MCGKQRGMRCCFVSPGARMELGELTKEGKEGGSAYTITIAKWDS